MVFIFNLPDLITLYKLAFFPFPFEKFIIIYTKITGTFSV